MLSGDVAFMLSEERERAIVLGVLRLCCRKSVLVLSESSIRGIRRE